MELEEIHRRSRSGPLLMLGRRVFAVMIGLLTTVVIPHFLDPAAYGLAAIASLIFTLGEIFKDFGMGSALLRKGVIDTTEMTFLFWFNVTTTVVITVLIAATSPLAALFFHQPAVMAIILVSLIGFAVSGMAMQHRGLLNRNLRFADLAMIDSFSLLMQFALTLLLAVFKFGVWAIVAGNVIFSIVNAILCVIRSKWTPGKPALIEELGAVLSFGANTSIYTLAVFFSNNITPILIGNLLSISSLGQYNMANNLLSQPLKNLVEPLTQATLPVMARLRPFPEIYRTTYLTFLQRLNLAVLPATIFLLFAARPSVDAVLGSKWHEAGDLLAILAPVVGVLGFGYAVSDLFITQNRSSELRTLGLFEAAIRVSAVFIGVKFGLYFAAGAYAIATVGVVALRVYIASSKGPVGLRDHLGTALPSLPIMLGVAFGCGAGQLAASALQAGSLVKAFIICATGMVFGIAATMLAGTSRNAIISLLNSLRPASAVIEQK